MKFFEYCIVLRKNKKKEYLFFIKKNRDIVARMLETFQKVRKLQLVKHDFRIESLDAKTDRTLENA